MAAAAAQGLDPRTARSRPYELSGKERAITAAKEMQAIVDREVKKPGVTDPKYEFLELIGKGAFGRVYKSKHVPTNRVVAVKIIDIDAADFSSKGEDTARDVLRETGALRALKESHAKNINVIYDAFFLASYVWIVSEYCPGGSVHTLMRASPEPGLNEAYIIPIARELAEALKWVHNAGIIHRDVKAANILISEDGRVQLCDFGVAGVLESKINKRSTILGTPHYMAPEMLDVIESNRIVHYGNEIDIWAFGCTLYELATGYPPNARVAHEHLRFVVRDKAPRLEGAKYSPGLREFVAFCIEESPKNRPSIEKVQNHYYIFNTSKRYPTSSLKRLLYDYYVWERSGGQRASLFMPGGAPLPEPSKEQDEEEEWNFSTTEIFDKSFAEAQSTQQSSFLGPASAPDYHHEAHAISRGGQSSEAHRRIPLKPLERLFIADDTYNYLERGQRANMAPSDLPLREQNENSSRRETVIDAGAFDASTGIATIPDMSTVRGNKKFGRFLRDSDDEGEETVKFQEENENRRATKDWKFPSLTVPADEGHARRKTQDWKFPAMTTGGNDEPTSAVKLPASTAGAERRPTLMHAATEPIGTSFAGYDNPDDSKLASSPHSIIDLDDYGVGPAYAGGSSLTSMGNPSAATAELNIGSEEHVALNQSLRSGPSTPKMTSATHPDEAPASMGPQAAEASTNLGTSPSSERVFDSRALDYDEEVPDSEEFRAAQKFYADEQWKAWKDHPIYQEYPLESMREPILPEDMRDDRPFDEKLAEIEEALANPLRPQTRFGDADFPTMHRVHGHLHPVTVPGDPGYGLSFRHRVPGPSSQGAGQFMGEEGQQGSSKDGGNEIIGGGGQKPFSDKEVRQFIRGGSYGNVDEGAAIAGNTTATGAEEHAVLESTAGPAYARPSFRSHSSESEDEEDVQEHRRGPNPFQLGPLPAPPSAAALAEGADPELLAGELERMLNCLMSDLGAVRAGLEEGLSRDQRRAAQKAGKKMAKKAAKAAKKETAQQEAEEKKAKEEKAASATGVVPAPADPGEDSSGAGGGDKTAAANKE